MILLCQDETVFNAHREMRRYIDAAKRSVFKQFDQMDAALGEGKAVRDAVMGDRIRAAMHTLIGSARLTGFHHASRLTGKRMPALYGRDIRLNAERRSEKVNSRMLRTTRMRYRTKPESDFTFSEGRAMSAARFEAARAYYRGVRDGLEGSDFDKRWMTTSADPCDYCQDNEDDGYIPVDEEFASGDMYPLRHLNCRCYIVTRPARMEASVLCLTAGGPGSGCRGDNCGRPSEHKLHIPGVAVGKNQIRTTKATYRIRGHWTVDQLNKLYHSFTQKYGTSLDFDRWLIERGKVYFKTSKQKLDANQWFETYAISGPIPNYHPPSLKNPQKVKIPFSQDGFQKGASPAARKQAMQDLVEIHKRLRRQIGKPEIAETAIMPVYTNIAQWI